ncbi:TonB-dependent receptor [Polymorphobacter sp. PAMC 29334]|uniref:TonB-dependent receptor n=1 Tax=Polymorphobacter sp. PAMC 29334 TaxID=2862331 RepID=UPI001C7928A7|nr:TonB-dependent receptor [Polymorphobacter sp. PAMC 29334]QYE33884.1 TonB-dependent receptor [Polymorphobacter sp. PAMC 29334]
MRLHRHILVGSASSLAIILGTAPALAADAPMPDEIVVTGVRASLERAIDLKRTSDNHVEAISAEDIGKLPDKNVADALQRLPGLNTSSASSGEGGFDENNRVSIRGTSPSLTQVTIDGHSVATGDWFVLDQFSTVGRSTSFDLLPSEIVSAVIVSKTQDASLLEGGVAGSIDLRLRSGLDLKSTWTVEASAQGAYNTQSHETKPQVNALIGWHNDDNTLGVIVQGFYEERSLRRYGQETLGYGAITASNATGAAIPSLVGVQAPTLIGSTLFTQQRRREGGVATVDWKATDKLEFKASGFYSYLNASNVNDNYLYWGSRELDRNVPTSYTVKNNTLVAASFPLVATSGPFTGQPIEGIVADNIVRPDANAASWFANLDATYKASDRLTIKGQVGYTRGTGRTPSSPFFEVDAPTGVSYGPSGNGFAVTTANINPGSPVGVSNDFAINETFTSTDQEAYGKLDANYDISSGAFRSIDAGVRIAEHKRQTVGWDRGCTLGADGQCYSAGLFNFAGVNPTLYPGGFNANALGIPGLLIPLAGDPATITKVINNIAGGVRGPISAIVQPQNEYWPGEFKVKETDVEGYILAHIGGEGWRGNVGLRVASTSERAFVNVPVSCAPATATVPTTCAANVITTSAYGPFYINEVKHNYVDFLPSINLTFDISQKVLLRLAAAETMSRPDFSALGGTVSLTDTNFTGSGGNPNLRPIKATVFDGSLEYYYAPAALAAISVFHDDLQSYVTFGTSVGNYFTQLDNKFHDYTISSPTNTSGQLSGVELQLQQPIAYGFGFQANGTYVNGHESSGAPLVGTSKFTYNVVGYYDKGPLNVRLAYTYRSHYFVGLDRSSAENQSNYGTLDGSANFAITKNLTLTVDALNITNAKLKYYAQTTDQPRAVYANGTQVFFGVRAKF